MAITVFPILFMKKFVLCVLRYVLRELKFRILRRSWKRNRVANILHTG